MAPAETTCPQCGEDIRAEEACEHCGYRFSDDEQGWLKVGDALEMPVAPDAVELEVDHDEVVVHLEVVELWEDQQTRRVFLSQPYDITDTDDEKLEDEVFEQLPDTFVVEQDEAPVRCQDEKLPEELASRVRAPLYATEYQGRDVAVFPNDAGLALDEIVDIADGQLTVAQVRAVFSRVVEALSDLHERGLYHLRLTPWTLRIRDDAEREGLPLEFLREPTDEAKPPEEPIGLAEDTLSEFDVDTHSDQGEGSPDFSGDKTRDDVVPLVDYDIEEGFGGQTSDVLSEGGEVFVTESESLRTAADEEPRLEIVYDGIEGFFESDGAFEEVPVIRGFSPPELVTGSPTEIGPTCDVFSLGMVLYFLIAGRLPPVSVYTRHVPAVPARNLRPSFPPGLQSVIGRATRPSPEERYPNIEALKKAFDDACSVMKERVEADRDTPRMQVAVDTHVGINKGRRNPTNQDAVFSARSDDGHFGLVVVADGVSTASYGSGDLASHMLVEEAEAAWEEMLPGYLMEEPRNPTDLIADILNRANDRIVSYVNENFVPFSGSPHEVMGSTALVALLDGGTVTLAALGDSRVYLQRGVAFEQITIDHNLWTLSILEGVPADNALAMPHGDALARCLGTFVVEGERLRPVDPEPDIFQFEVTSGDNLLLTTDGLVDFAAANMIAAEDKIHQVLVSEPDPALACLELILLANRGGGGDNIGLGIVKYE
ncbi:MAG: protein phosphatase 2C domain-containing protein [Persicimonas sp.]